MKTKKFVINLDRRSDRLSGFYDRYGSREIEVFSAVDGFKVYEEKNFTVNQKIIYKKLEDRLKRYPGLFGCWASHFELWNKIVGDSDEINSYVIFEDDAFFSDNHIELIKKALGYVSQNLDIIYIGGRSNRNFIPRNFGGSDWRQLEENLYEPVSMRLGYNLDRTTHGYIITKNGARKLLSFIPEEKDSSLPAVDGWMNRARTRLCTADFFPHICWSPNNYQTDIQGILIR